MSKYRKNLAKVIVVVVVAVFVSGFTFWQPMNAVKTNAEGYASLEDEVEVSESKVLTSEIKEIPSEVKVLIEESEIIIEEEVQTVTEAPMEAEEPIVIQEVEEEEVIPEESTEEIIEETVQEAFIWDGPVLNSYDGIVPSNQTPSGYKETYYNLDMSGVVYNMRNLGYSEEEYPYWVREDGVKMFGDYVCVALIADKGIIIPTTLGLGMVVDYCPAGTLDVAVTW